MRLTPYQLTILLHYYVSPTDYPFSPIYETTVMELQALGLMGGELGEGRNKRLTPKGEAYVEFVLTTPIPEQVWVLPERDGRAQGGRA